MNMRAARAETENQQLREEMADMVEEIGRLRFHDRDADIARQAAALGPQGRAVLALVENRDPDAVARLIAALPERVRTEIDDLEAATAQRCCTGKALPMVRTSQPPPRR